MQPLPGPRGPHLRPAPGSGPEGRGLREDGAGDGSAQPPPDTRSEAEPAESAADVDEAYSLDEPAFMQAPSKMYEQRDVGFSEDLDEEWDAAAWE